MKAMKAKTKAKKTAKGKAKGKAKAEAKAMVADTWERFLNREHSKVWHPERNYCRSELGLTDEVAKQRAKDKAKVRVSALTKQRQNNELKDFPPVPK
jgi:hypothetical protein